MNFQFLNMVNYYTTLYKDSCENLRRAIKNPRTHIAKINTMTRQVEGYKVELERHILESKNKNKK